MQGSQELIIMMMVMMKVVLLMMEVEQQVLKKVEPTGECQIESASHIRASSRLAGSRSPSQQASLPLLFA